MKAFNPEQNKPSAILIAADLCLHDTHVDVAMQNKDVFEIFEANPQLLNLPVLDGVHIVGIVSRDTFMRSMARRYHWELYSKKRCSKMMGLDPLVVEADTPIRDLAQLLQASGEARTLADGFVVTENGSLVGTGRTSDVLATIVVHEKQAAEQLRRHRDRLSKTVNELTRANTELKSLNGQLDKAEKQLLQSEKMASIGVLAAGVAHEINNPIGFVQSNLTSLEHYVSQLFKTVASCESALRERHLDTDAIAVIERIKNEVDFEFLREDLAVLLVESKDGIARVSKIVEDLRTFSRVDASPDWEFADLHKGLESTLNIVGNEIKYKADIVREYEDIPAVECLPSQINQVFLNLLVNSAHAIPDGSRGTITLRSWHEDGQVYIQVADTGCGIPLEVQSRIFDPFFTTKPVGKGTGLGLSLSYGIVEKHQGSINVESELGRGTTLTVCLPIRQLSPGTSQSMEAMTVE